MKSAYKWLALAIAAGALLAPGRLDRVRLRQRLDKYVADGATVAKDT